MQRSSGRVSIGRLSTLAVVVSLIATVTVSCTTSPLHRRASARPHAAVLRVLGQGRGGPAHRGQRRPGQGRRRRPRGRHHRHRLECTDSGRQGRARRRGPRRGQGGPVGAGQRRSSAQVAAVTGDEISAGQPVLENLSVQALSAEIGLYGITVRGNVVGAPVGRHVDHRLRRHADEPRQLVDQPVVVGADHPGHHDVAGRLQRHADGSTNGVPSLSLSAARQLGQGR